MKTIILILLLSFNISGFGQEKEIQGEFSLGVRNVNSLFNDGNFDNTGIGVGGQFRIRLSEKVNTEWFLDYITTDLYNLASRKDYHIGWSVMYYFLNQDKPFIKPYFVAGHCFDNTNVKENFNENNNAQRLSSAVQMGVGTHINLSEKFDLTLLGQYMIHLGSDIHAEPMYDMAGGSHFHIEKTEKMDLEGHILLSMSLNYKIGKLW